MSGARLSEDADELLHRQVHPNFLQNGRPSSQAFRPTPKDKGLLSVSQGSLATAEEAYLLYTENKGLKSAGVWSVTVGECRQLNLSAFHDPVHEPVQDLAHAVIDFRTCSKKELEKYSKTLAVLARARGRQYPPDTA
jgi:hypothetical protein